MRQSANTEGMTQSELEAALKMCREKQKILSEEMTKQTQAAYDDAVKTVRLKFRRRLHALFMWDSMYCRALASFESR